jgi:hypothetical protein
MFIDFAQSSSTANGSPVAQRSLLPSNLPAEFWRWAGWKTRERLKIMEHLMVHIKSQTPYLKVGVEIRSQSLHDPVNALIHFSEDYLETVQRGFDVFLVSSEPVRGLLVDRMMDVVDDPKRVWVMVSSTTDSGFGHVSSAQKFEFPEGMGVVYDHRTIP